MAEIAEQIYQGLVIAGGTALTQTQLETIAKAAFLAENAYLKIQKIQRG